MALEICKNTRAQKYLHEWGFKDHQHIFEVYYPKLLQYISSRWTDQLSHEDAEEIAQEALANFFVALAQGVPVDQYNAYLYRSAQNLAVSRWRKIKKTVEATAQNVENMSGEVVASPDKATEFLFLRQAVQQLPAPLRDSIEMRFYQELGVVEIAGILEIGAGTVTKHVQKGLMILRRLLGDPGIVINSLEPPPRRHVEILLLGGEVSGVTQSNFSVIAYAYVSDAWHVQPSSDSPHTKISATAEFKTATQCAPRYATLLVDNRHRVRTIRHAIEQLGTDVHGIDCKSAEELGFQSLEI